MVYSYMHTSIYYININEIPGELSGDNMISSHVKKTYRKIPKISPGAYIFQRPWLRGLFLEGLISEGLTYGGTFAIQNRLG